MFLNVSCLKVILSCTELTVELSMVRSYPGWNRGTSRHRSVAQSVDTFRSAGVVYKSEILLYICAGGLQ